MEYVKPLLHLIVGLELLEKCSGFPADLSSTVRRGGGGGVGVAGVGFSIATPQVVGVALLAAVVSLLVGCACCGRRKGFRTILQRLLSAKMASCVSPETGVQCTGVARPCQWHPVASWDVLPVNSATQTESTANAATLTTPPTADMATEAVLLQSVVPEAHLPILTALLGHSAFTKCKSATPCRSRVTLPCPRASPYTGRDPRQDPAQDPAQDTWTTRPSSSGSSLSVLQTLCGPKEESCSSFVFPPIGANHPHICVVQPVDNGRCAHVAARGLSLSQWSPSQLQLQCRESRGPCPCPLRNLDNVCVTPLCVSERDLVSASRNLPPNRRVILHPPIDITAPNAASELNNSMVSSQQSVGRGGSNGAPSSASRAPSEFTIFPPGGVSLSSDRSSIVQFEPLPDIRPTLTLSTTSAPPLAPPPAPHLRKPPVFHNPRLSPEDWFLNAQVDFPRNQLQYLREVGQGWFGRVVEGEAKGIDPGKLVSKVVVKILHEDATSADQMYFLDEVKPYRDLRHPNVLRLVGRCLETGPFLILLEYCSSGSLKSFLCQNVSSADALCQQGVILSMACGVTAGLQHMIENGFVHTDLAARNCLVAADLTVKVGDYGTSVETFKDEYYCAGDMALPIRWCAPETLHCTDTIIETKEVTASANVWSLAVVLWEVCEFGSLPYSDCSDEQVIQYVLTSGSKRLPPPSRTSQPHAHNLYHLMKLCWNKPEKRPPIERISSMLNHLYQHCDSPAHTSANNNNNSATSLDDFERRWEMSKPNTIPKCDDADLPQTNLFSRRRSLEETSPPSSFSRLKSPSLHNLRGSTDELGEHVLMPILDTPDLDSWLQGMDTSTEEEVRFVRNISEAIRDLDDALAQERTSSSSQGSSANHSPSRKGQSGPVDFLLGPITSESHIESDGPDSLNRKVESSGSDTEDETWRIRIERGEFSEKVKEKSKSVADLMVLTHIDNSDNSDSDSLQDVDVADSSLKRNNSIRRKPLASSAALGYGSDGNIHGAVLGEELRETIRRLHESWRDESRLEVIVDASLPYASLEESHSQVLANPDDSTTEHHFLGKAASDTSTNRTSSECSVEEAAAKEDEEPVTVILGPSEDFTLDYFRGLKTVYTEPEDDVTCIETWDKLLDNYSPPEGEYPSFSQVCLSQSEPSSPGRGTEDILGSSFETTPAKVILRDNLSLTDDSPCEHIEEHLTSDDSIYGSMKLSDFGDSTGNIMCGFYEKRFKVCKDSEMEEDEDDYCLDPTKNHTPDDERSSDSGFRDKGSLSESCEDACDEKYNLEDVELEEAFSRNVLRQETEDPCQRLDVLLSKEDDVTDEVVADEVFNKHESSPLHESSGWFLHPQKSDDIAGLTLNEEFANAIRNELRDKLTAFQQSQESTKQLSDEESLSDSESEESPQKERANIVIQYKTYSAPLSPILEEKESLSSDNCSPYNRDKSSLESEPGSPIFVFDPTPSSAAEASNFEDDIRKALSECPAEADENWSELSFDGTSVAEDDPDTLPLDSDSLNTETKRAATNVDAEDYPELDDDVLLVDTETNEVTLLEKPKADKIENEQIGLAFERFLRPATLCDSNAMTPDSISPNVLSPDSPMKEFPPTETCYGQMEEIIANNEAAEIVSDLENCGFLSATYEPGTEQSPTYSSLPPIQVKNVTDSSFSSHSPSEETILNLAPLDASFANVDSIKEEWTQLFQPEELKVLAKRICDAQIKYYAKNRLASSDLDSLLCSPNSLYKEHLFQDVTIEEIDNDADLVSDDMADDQLMSTSFMVTEMDDGDRPYPLDWESDDANSSSSGEFIWKDGENESSVKVAMASPESDFQSYDLGVPEYTMASIVEEDEEENSSSDGGDSESETEFVPSAWNSEATPKRSALRPPHKKQQEEKKNVSFKRQRYHCVYEYPREVCDNEGTEYDFMYHDDMFWGGEDGVSMIPPTADAFSHFYNPSNLDKFSCQDWNQNMSEEDELFISSSAQPFDYIGGDAEESVGENVGVSEFFPGRDFVDEVDGDASNSESDPEMVTASEHTVVLKSSGDSSSDAYKSFPSNDSTDADADTPPSPLSPVCLLGELRHTRDRLKLDFLLEAPAKKRSVERSVEQVKGEASLLDGDCDVDSDCDADCDDDDVDVDVDERGIDSGKSRTLDFHPRSEHALQLTT